MRAKQIVNKKSAKAFGWQVVFNEEFEDEGFRQFHYLGIKLTGKQVRTLIKRPFLSLENLTGRCGEYHYVVATKLILEDHKGKQTEIKVARKEWKAGEALKLYLQN